LEIIFSIRNLNVIENYHSPRSGLPRLLPQSPSNCFWTIRNPKFHRRSKQRHSSNPNRRHDKNSRLTSKRLAINNHKLTNYDIHISKTNKQSYEISSLMSTQSIMCEKFLNVVNIVLLLHIEFVDADFASFCDYLWNAIHFVVNFEFGTQH